jgi:hypothetical protein
LTFAEFAFKEENLVRRLERAGMGLRTGEEGVRG